VAKHDVAGACGRILESNHRNMVRDLQQTGNQNPEFEIASTQTHLEGKADFRVFHVDEPKENIG